MGANGKHTDDLGTVVSRWLKQAVDNLPLGLTLTDASGRIVYTNLADAAMHGYEVPELLGRDVRIFAPDPEQSSKPWLAGKGLHQTARWERESLNGRKGRGTFPVYLLSDLVRDETGEPVGMFTTCEDLTDRRETMERLRQSQKMEALGQLTSGIAHDFNNVLTVILTNLGLLTELGPGDADEHRQLIREALEVTRQGAGMARQLLAFSREGRLELRPVDIGQIAMDYSAVIRRLLPESIEVRVETAPDLPVVEADRSAVQQILLSVATNARDAMASGGVLRVRVARASLDEEFRATHGWGTPGNYVTVMVADTGTGMDADTRQKIFNPFFTTKPPGKGTGLGMAMVYGLMKQHRGFVHVYSELGRGTTVKLWFPSAVAPEFQEVLAARPAVVGGSETILVVEDEAALRRAAQRVLARYGYTVLAAADGEEALQVVRDRGEEIDLIVSDVVMPRLGGAELISRLRKGGVTVPVLLASGHGAEELAASSPLKEGQPFLQKPWTVPDLLRRVREMLDAKTSG